MRVAAVLLFLCGAAAPAGAVSCCWSKWGDAATCGGYPAGGQGGLCSTDYTKPCSQINDCVVRDDSCGAAWAQCGGVNWNGHDCCQANCECIKSDDWYSQCKPPGNTGNDCGADRKPTEEPRSPPAPIDPAEKWYCRGDNPEKRDCGTTGGPRCCGTTGWKTTEYKYNLGRASEEWCNSNCNPHGSSSTVPGDGRLHHACHYEEPASHLLTTDYFCYCEDGSDRRRASPKSYEARCDGYRNQAAREDGRVCRKRSADSGKWLCMKPNAGDGKCPGDHDCCLSTEPGSNWFRNTQTCGPDVDCSGVECPAPESQADCVGDQVFTTKPGKCCGTCELDCSTWICPACVAHEPDPGECCGKCKEGPDCSGVKCAINPANCVGDEVFTTKTGECCGTCKLDCPEACPECVKHKPNRGECCGKCIEDEGSCGRAWAKCGGNNYLGKPTLPESEQCCQEGCTCKYFHREYSQCIPPGNTGNDCGASECRDGDTDTSNPCSPRTCEGGKWQTMVIDCEPEEMCSSDPDKGIVAEYVKPARGECCGTCARKCCPGGLEFDCSHLTLDNCPVDISCEAATLFFSDLYEYGVSGAKTVYDVLMASDKVTTMCSQNWDSCAQSMLDHLNIDELIEPEVKAMLTKDCLCGGSCPEFPAPSPPSQPSPPSPPPSPPSPPSPPPCPPPPSPPPSPPSPPPSPPSSPHWYCRAQNGDRYEAACDEYRNQAAPENAQVCRKQTDESGVWKCMKPNAGDGRCPGDHDCCKAGQPSSDWYSSAECWELPSCSNEWGSEWGLTERGAFHQIPIKWCYENCRNAAGWHPACDPNTAPSVHHHCCFTSEDNCQCKQTPSPTASTLSPTASTPSPTLSCNEECVQFCENENEIDKDEEEEESKKAKNALKKAKKKTKKCTKVCQGGCKELKKLGKQVELWWLKRKKKQAKTEGALEDALEEFEDHFPIAITNTGSPGSPGTVDPNDPKDVFWDTWEFTANDDNKKVGTVDATLKVNLKGESNMCFKLSIDSTRKAFKKAVRMQVATVFCAIDFRCPDLAQAANLIQIEEMSCKEFGQQDSDNYPGDDARRAAAQNNGQQSTAVVVVNVLNPANPIGGGQLSGDPFTAYKGKTTQFFLPLDKVVPLTKCGGLELFGGVIPSAVPGDNSQWFNRFRMDLNGKELAAVSVREASSLLPDQGSDFPARIEQAADSDADVAVEEQGRTTPDGPDVRAGLNLTTVHVAVAKQVVKQTGAFRPYDNTTVVVRRIRDGAQRIGLGFAESVDVAVGVREFSLHSVPAGKFPALADRVRHVHLDMSIRGGSMDSCSGALPEIWGLRPLSEKTAKLLFPNK